MLRKPCISWNRVCKNKAVSERQLSCKPYPKTVKVPCRWYPKWYPKFDFTNDQCSRCIKADTPSPVTFGPQLSLACNNIQPPTRSWWANGFPEVGSTLRMVHHWWSPGVAATQVLWRRRLPATSGLSRSRQKAQLSAEEW